MDENSGDTAPYLTIGRFFAAGLVVLTGGALVSASTQILLDLAERNPTPFWYPLIWEFTGYYSALALLPAFYAAGRRWPFVRGRLARHLAVHLGLAAVLSSLLTTLFLGLRVLVYHVFDLGIYEHGILAWRYLFEFQKFIVFYAFMHLLVWIHDSVMRGRVRERDALRLSQELTEARLQSLAAQVNPHFLFNTLNTISSVMYDDPEAADRMIARLSDLLRASLQHSGHHLVPLSEERRFLELYVDLMRARFGERLDVVIDVSPDASDARVPAFLLQPLVENAIKHHPAERRSAIRIRVGARIEAERLIVEVEDNGAFGEEELASGTGTGLRNLRSRLAHLYGERHGPWFERSVTGGLLVRIALPLQP